MNVQRLRLDECLGITRSSYHERPFLANELKLGINEPDSHPFKQFNKEVDVKKVNTVDPVTGGTSSKLESPKKVAAIEEDSFQYSHPYLRLERLINGYFDKLEERKRKEAIEKLSASTVKNSSASLKQLKSKSKGNSATKNPKTRICKFQS
jgi:hypothetical protein